MALFHLALEASLAVGLFLGFITLL